MSRGKPGTRQQRDPQYEFLPGVVGSFRRFTKMDLSGQVNPYVVIDQRIPSKSFPDLTDSEIALLKGSHVKA